MSSEYYSYSSEGEEDFGWRTHYEKVAISREQKLLEEKEKEQRKEQQRKQKEKQAHEALQLEHDIRHAEAAFNRDLDALYELKRAGPNYKLYICYVGGAEKVPIAVSTLVEKRFLYPDYTSAVHIFGRGKRSSMCDYQISDFFHPFRPETDHAYARCDQLVLQFAREHPHKLHKSAKRHFGIK